ncbi:hypothetical protein QCA50_007705 [Cerrena zonata]|uniref:Uncharacterized protein n=1 Tax=Cerrena zonata TaxID=2478898 RepID=A0AAW0GCF3_9APHY
MTRAAGFAYAQRGICTAKTWFEIRGDHTTRIPTIIAMASGPIADGISALTVAMSLYHSSPHVKIRRMRHVVTWLLVMTVNTGFILLKDDN